MSKDNPPRDLTDFTTSIDKVTPVESETKFETIPLQEFIQRIDVIVTQAEQAFYTKYNCYPILTSVDDVTKLAEFINVPKECEKFKNVLIIGGDAKVTTPRSADFELGLRLVVGFLKREGIFSGERQDEMFDALRGRIYYDITEEEYRYRINLLEKFEREGIPFPNDWSRMVEASSNICKTGNATTRNSTVFDRVGDSLINPSTGNLMEIRRAQSFGDIKEYLSRGLEYRMEGMKNRAEQGSPTVNLL